MRSFTKGFTGQEAKVFTDRATAKSINLPALTDVEIIREQAGAAFVRFAHGENASLTGYIDRSNIVVSLDDVDPRAQAALIEPDRN